MYCKNCSQELHSVKLNRIPCSICGKQSIIPVDHTDICEDCSNSIHVCMKCGNMLEVKNET